MPLPFRPLTAAELALVEALPGGPREAEAGAHFGAHLRAAFEVAGEDALVAEREGRIEAAGLLQSFGAVGLLGPVRADLRGWSGGARRLVEELVRRAEQKGLTALLAFAPGEGFHLINTLTSLGFLPRHFVARMSHAAPFSERPVPDGWLRVAAGAEGEAALLSAAELLAVALTPGYRISGWLKGRRERDGEELIAWPGSGGGLDAWAVLRPSAVGFEVPLALVRPGPEAKERFSTLIDVCEAVCGARGGAALSLAANAGTSEVYEALVRRGYRNVAQGFALHRPGASLHFRPGVFALHPWC